MKLRQIKLDPANNISDVQRGSAYKTSYIKVLGNVVPLFRRVKISLGVHGTRVTGVRSYDRTGTALSYLKQLRCFRLIDIRFAFTHSDIVCVKKIDMLVMNDTQCV